jgi:hypothetical protein
MIPEVKKIQDLAKLPMYDDRDIRRVEIVVLKFKEEENVITECLKRIVTSTTWPFKLNVYDNRMNTANTSKIWNKIIRESTCDYVVLIDSDAFVPTGIDPCWLTRMMESIDDKGVVVAMLDNCGGSNRSDEPRPYPSAIPQEGIWSGACTLYKKSIFNKVGEFDEDFYLYGQDSEFAHRILKKTGGATFRMDVVVKHIGGHSAKKSHSEGELDREADKMYARHLYKKKTDV